jgi:hypothetical protein
MRTSSTTRATAAAVNMIRRAVSHHDRDRFSGSSPPRHDA